MQKYMEIYLDERQLARFDAFLNNESIIMFTDKASRYVSTRNILIGGVYNLIVEKVQNSYNIKIDPNINIPNTYAKFIDVIKLVNNGNLSLAAYPIYTDMMNHFAENLQDYYGDYLEDGEE